MLSIHQSQFIKKGFKKKKRKKKKKAWTVIMTRILQSQFIKKRLKKMNTVKLIW